MLVLLGLMIVHVSNPLALAADYNRPAGVEILGGEQIVQHLAGNSLANRMYVEFYVSPATDQQQGPLRGRSQTYGDYVGRWSIEGQLICIEYEQRLMMPLGDCYTVALVGEETRIYRKDGFEMYPDGGRLKRLAGNPENL